MNEQTNKTVTAQPLFQTVAYCLFALGAAFLLRAGLFLPGLFLLMAASGVLTVLFFSCPRVYAALEGLAMFAILFVAGGADPWMLLFGAIAVLLAVVLFYAIRKRNEKGTVTLFGTGALFAITAAGLLIWYVASGNEFSFSAMQSLIDDFFGEIHLLMDALVRETYAALPPETVAIYEASGVTLSQLIDAALDNMAVAVELVKKILPGILLFALQALSFTAVSAFHLTAKLSYGTALIPTPHFAIFPTKVSCVVFMATASLYAICSVFVSSVSTFMVMVLNMLLAVMPAMLACGVSCLRMRLLHPYTKTKTIVIVVLVAIGCVILPTYVAPIAVLLLGFVGAQDVFVIRMLKEQQERADRGEDDDEYMD